MEKLEIDCIAITNHNIFDKNQFETICEELPIKVFPGIEINLEGGHLLLISENENLDDFSAKCQKITDLIKLPSDYISVEQLNSFFLYLNKYLLIPHYDKKPRISDEVLSKLGDNIFVGEVTSIRKFKACLKEEDKLTPVLFSDYRFVEEDTDYPTRQTYIDATESTLVAIKGCLFDKNKVYLSKRKEMIFFKPPTMG